MNPHWVIDREHIAAVLEERGFDIDTSDASLPEGGGSLSARLDKGDRAVVLKVDSGGHLVITESEVLDDRARNPLVIEDVKLVVTERLTRRRNYRGTIRDIGQFHAILKAILVTDEAAKPP